MNYCVRMVVGFSEMLNSDMLIGIPKRSIRLRHSFRMLMLILIERREIELPLLIFDYSRPRIKMENLIPL